MCFNSRSTTSLLWTPFCAMYLFHMTILLLASSVLASSSSLQAECYTVFFKEHINFIFQSEVCWISLLAVDNTLTESSLQASRWPSPMLLRGGWLVQGTCTVYIIITHLSLESDQTFSQTKLWCPRSVYMTFVTLTALPLTNNYISSATNQFYIAELIDTCMQELVALYKVRQHTLF